MAIRSIQRLTKTREEVIDRWNKRHAEAMNWVREVLWQRKVFYLSISGILGYFTGFALTVMISTKIDIAMTIVLAAITLSLFCFVVWISVERICHDTKTGNWAAAIFCMTCYAGGVSAILLIVGGVIPILN